MADNYYDEFCRRSFVEENVFREIVFCAGKKL
jgi:hypothetical protein